MDWKTAQCVLCDTILTPKQGKNCISGGRIKCHLFKFHKDHPDIIEERKNTLILKKKQETKESKFESERIYSSIWDQFDKDQTNLYAKCKVCQYAVFKLQDGDSPELKKHMVTKHPYILIEQ